MRIIRPKFWDAFQCIGGACTDNCCIGWEICIDDETLEYYQEVHGAMGARLKKSIVKEKEEYSFRMCNGRCVFLNEENLCDLIIGLGDDSLCDICREHPRFYEDFGVRQEAGLGLCCEEAVRLLLENKRPLEFEMVEIDDGNQETENYDWFQELDAVRTVIFEILQNRKRPWNIRMKDLLILTGKIQDQMDKENLEGIWKILQTYSNYSDFYEEVSDKNVEKSCPVSQELWMNGRKEILNIFLDMEVMDVKWHQRLLEIRDNMQKYYEVKEIYHKEMQSYAYEMEHLAVYQIFRYFLKGIDDEDVLSKSRMAVAACLIIELLHMATWCEKGKLTQWDRIVNIKAYSKELEYCPENVEMLMDALWDERFEKMYTFL